SARSFDLPDLDARVLTRRSKARFCVRTDRLGGDLGVRPRRRSPGSSDPDRLRHYGEPTLGGGEESFVVDGLSYSTNFMPVDNGIYFVSGARGPEARNAIEFYDFATGKRRALISLDKPIRYGIALSPDYRSLVHGLVDHASSNLMLVENYR